ncbi:MAG: hypothetical protein HY023_16520 [Chloroflexi bacterium]|nr:hypothetical protein [Chloroflexota bacterium]
MNYVAYPEGEYATIEHVPTGERWQVKTNGNAPAFSPDATQMVWQVGGTRGPLNNRRNDLFAANVDGGEARHVATFLGGGVAAWFPDSAHLLVIARPSDDTIDRAISVFDLADGSSRELARAERIGGARLSRGGTWVAFTITFAPNPADSGLWLARTDGGEVKRLDLYGAYRWRDDARLFVIPFEPGAGSNVLWEVDAATGAARPITDPTATPFLIANGDWAVSPNGGRIVFLNAADRALWLLSLP